MPIDGRPREPKACQACAQAKVKCEPETPNGCKRCLRLRRTCVMQPPGAHKRKPQESPSDVSRLEQKLDDITAIFTAASRKLLGANLEEQNQRERSPSSGLPHSLEDILPNDEEGARSLSNFRNEVTPYFPFIVVPEDMSVSELRQRKPFLFSTIAMVTCYDDSTRQFEIAKSIKQHISTDIMMKEEFNIDIFQGLLVFLSWYHLQVPIGVHISNLLHLTMSMMIDLGLHKKPIQNTKMSPIINHSHTAKYSTQRTLDARRAYLGCFYLNCVITMCIVDMDPMRYTGYTEECCRLIEDAGEYPSDIFLVRLVRMHRMTDRINRAFNFDQYDPTELIMSAPIGMSIRSLESELHKIKESITPITLTDSFLLMHYHALELRLYAVALDEDFPPERYGNYPLTRLNILYSCLLSAKASFVTLSSIPLTDYFRIPYPVVSTFMHAVGILSRLVLFTGDNWDPEYARSIIDFQTAVDMSVGRLQELVDTYGSTKLPYRIPGAFARLLPRVNLLKELHEMRRSAIENNKESGGDATAGTTIPFTYDFLQDMNFLWPGDISWHEFIPE